MPLPQIDLTGESDDEDEVRAQAAQGGTTVCGAGVLLAGDVLCHERSQSAS